MKLKQFLALLGFLFVAAWIAFNFGDAILCLVGAAIFYAFGAGARRRNQPRRNAITNPTPGTAR